MLKLFYILFIFLFISCGFKSDIPDCDCKFMLDLLVEKEENSSNPNKDLFDRNLFDACVVQYKDKMNDKSPRPLLINVFKYYHAKCPSYELEILE